MVLSQQRKDLFTECDAECDSPVFSSLFSFLNLPVEIIQRIAAHATPLSFIALCRTCSNLRDICWHYVVLRDICVRDQTHLTVYGSRYANLARVCVRDDLYWLRFAVAHQKAEQLHEGIDQDFNNDVLPRMLKWAPALVITGHPIIESEWLAVNISKSITTQHLDFPGVFCYATAMMSASDRAIMMIRDELLRNERSIRILYKQITRIKSQWKLFRAMGAFVLLTRVKAPREGSLQNGLIRLPRATEMNLCPIDNSYYIPVPFETSLMTSEEDLVTGLQIWLDEHHIAVRNHPEYVSGHRWHCVYVFASEEHGPRWHTISDIHFKTHDSDEQQSRFDGSGTSRRDDSKMTLTLFANGQGRVVFRLDSTWSLWDCVLTPLGVYGTLSLSGLYQSTGAIWLYRENITH